MDARIRSGEQTQLRGGIAQDAAAPIPPRGGAVGGRPDVWTSVRSIVNKCRCCLIALVLIGLSGCDGCGDDDDCCGDDPAPASEAMSARSAMEVLARKTAEDHASNGYPADLAGVVGDLGDYRAGKHYFEVSAGKRPRLVNGIYEFRYQPAADGFFWVGVPVASAVGEQHPVYYSDETLAVYATYRLTSSPTHHGPQAGGVDWSLAD